MKNSGKQTTHQGTGRTYRIVVGGELSRRYAAAFEEMGMDMETEGGRTILTGVEIDQVHLHGILYRINRLALELLSVESCPKNKKTEQAGPIKGDAAAPRQGSRRT